MTKFNACKRKTKKKKKKNKRQIEPYYWSFRAIYSS